MKKYKHAAIIPLIGGLPIGVEKELGTPPEYILSYPAFGFNDGLLLRHYENKGLDIPYITIDAETNELIDANNGERLTDVDIVSSTCPCAGLSMLNASNGKSASSRGSDAAQNEWMYKSTEFVLGTVKPKVMFGENAPGFFTKLGAGVRERLRLIAEKHNYSYSVIKTSTKLHGIPQNRTRSFYFFWKSDASPILGYYDRERKSLIEYLNDIPDTASLRDLYSNELSPTDAFPTFEFLIERSGLSYTDFLKKTGGKKFSTVETILEEELYDEFCQWFSKKGYDTLDEKDRKRRIKAKIDRIWDKVKVRQAGGYWDESPQFNGDCMNALISKSVASFINPNENRYLNVREMLHLMGFPHDFEIKGKSEIHAITQNVPVNTAADWTHEVVKFLNGELPLSNTRYLMQDNCAQKIVLGDVEPAIKSKKLF